MDQSDLNLIFEMDQSDLDHFDPLEKLKKIISANGSKFISWNFQADQNFEKLHNSISVHDPDLKINLDKADPILSTLEVPVGVFENNLWYFIYSGDLR